MRAVVWTSGGYCFAIDSAQIVEVIPVVLARPLAQQPPWVQGLINYRQRLIPLLDMAILLRNNTPERRMANRVLVLRTHAESPEVEGLMGIVVEQVLGIESLDFTEATTQVDTRTSGFEFLGPVALTESDTIQLVDAQRLPTVDTETAEQRDGAS